MATAYPHRNFQFTVTQSGFTRGGFSKVSGLKVSTETIDYREGGETQVVRKLPGQTTYEPIVLERGQTNNGDFLDWCEQVHTVGTVAQASDEAILRPLVIGLLDRTGVLVREWEVSQAWPSEYERGEMDATGNDILIEKLVLQHAGVKEIVKVAD